ncbi:A/G-specific adenine glycosylase [Amphibiibacter pelophylacis]|uniref:A/G-specific adenine glycosylase n=1 Tax=Amphibiibacter pelophylacis TaxID=1799477 RepID=A0ACC6P4T0_9BURK
MASGAATGVDSGSDSGLEAPLPDDFAGRLVRWQRLHGRHGLPWQGTRDPYRVWLSEIMLQQTQVATVLDYYPRFLARFPDVAALAQAPLDDVLALWAGLGYYSRARNLHGCARRVMADWGGVFPARAADLVTLPGIGVSTAAAIAAFCHGERISILDGNVQRVLARHRGLDEDFSRAAPRRELQRLADALVPHASEMPVYTQALMDLGATRCTPRQAACDVCPVRRDCIALAQGRVHELPRKARATVQKVWAHALLLHAHCDCAGLWHVALVQRPATGVWSGLWTPPLLDEAQQAQRRAHAPPIRAHEAFLHVLTHRRWFLTPWLCATRGGDLPDAVALGLDGDQAAAMRWWTLDQAAGLALPAPVRARWLGWMEELTAA